MERGGSRLSPALAALLPLLLLTALRGAAGQGSPEFLVYPENVTAALGTSVTLECVANQPALAWTINDIQLLEETRVSDLIDAGFILGVGETEAVPGGNRTTLTIPASERVNDSVTGIVCQAGPTLFEVVDGETVSLSVYGLPLAPGQLEVEGDSPHQLRLSWSPPFTLPGETVSYSLEARDLATGLSEPPLPLSGTQYTHNLSEPAALACHSFLFSVSSVNAVGSSPNSSSAEPILHPSAPGPLGTVEAEVVHSSGEPVGERATLILTFERPVSCFPLNYSVSLREGVGETQVVGVPPQASSGSGQESLQVPGLRENSRYSALLSASNSFQFSTESPVRADEVTFVTSGLQSVVVGYGSGAVRVTCSFAPGSLSAGCRVSLSQDSSTTTTIDIPRTDGALEAVHYSPMIGVPSSVTGQDLGVDNPLVISGTVIIYEEPSSPTPSRREETSTKVALISTGVLLVCALACGSVVLALVAVRHCHKQRKLQDPQASNVEYDYDEVVFHNSTDVPAASISTEPNEAYATTRLQTSPIHTADNVAYSAIPPTTSDTIPTEPNEAYATTTRLQTPHIPTTDNIAYTTLQT
jgi:hypothetical protein